MLNNISILITRFNWPHPKWRDVTDVVYSEWIDDRLNAFREFTIPSIRNCYVKPDYWYILCDNRVTKSIGDQLSEMLQGLEYRLIFYKGVSIRESIIEQVKELELPALISTTRLDSDDLVACDFFARINSVSICELKRPIVISFPGGCNLDCISGEFYFSSYPDNPFLTLREYVGLATDLLTVYHRMHTEMLCDDFEILFLRSSFPMWVSVIHHAITQNDSLRSVNKICLGSIPILIDRFGISGDFLRGLPNLSVLLPPLSQ